MKFDLLHPADQLVMIMKRIYDNAMTTMSGGNLSILDDNGDIWITPSGIDKGNLTRDDICLVKPDGEVISKHKPSSELPFHKLIYQTRKDARAVLHAHPHALVSFSLLRQAPKTRLLPTTEIVCGKVGLSTYEVPGSVKLGQNIAKVFKQGYDVVMMENHGVVVCGNDLYEAYRKFETMETCARINLQSRILGEEVELTDEQIDLARNKSEAIMGEFIPANHSSYEREMRRQMCELIHRAYRQKLFTSTQGTFSTRLGEDSFLITPYNKDRMYLEPADIVRVDHGWREAGKRPSRSVKLHQMIYAAHPEIQSIMVTHPTNIMAFGITRTELDSRTIPESYINMRDVKRVPYGTNILHPEKIVEMVTPSSPLVMVENECVIITGSSLLNCFDKLEVAEFTAQTLIESKLLGTAVKISDQEVATIKKVFKLPD